jgi:hypothetical protein
MRDNWLSNRIFKSYDDLVDHCCAAWNKLVDQPWRIMSIGLRQRPTGSDQWDLVLVGEHERIVGKLNSRQFLRVDHHLHWFNPLTYRGVNRRIGGRGRPYSEPNRDQSGGKGKQGGLAHLSSPVQSAQPQHAVAQAV